MAAQVEVRIFVEEGGIEHLSALQLANCVKKNIL
jgi:hypothetical protein